MIIYILLAVILDKLSLFSGWIFCNMVNWCNYESYCIFDFIKSIIDIYKEI